MRNQTIAVIFSFVAGFAFISTGYVGCGGKSSHTDDGSVHDDGGDDGGIDDGDIDDGDIPDGDANGGDDLLELSELESKLLEASCSKYVECPISWEMALLMNNTQDCLDFYSLMDVGLSEFYEYLAEAIEDGRVLYDSEQAVACLEVFENLTCKELYDISHVVWECETIFVGLLEDGEACRADEECAGGWCDTNSSCPGECSTVIAENQPCEYYERCEPGLDCVEGVCEPYPEPAYEGEECIIGFAECAYGLYCDDYGTQECKPLGGEGDDCEYDYMCQPDKMCLETGCTTVTVIDQVGEECDPENEGKVCNVLSGLVCRMDLSEENNPWTVCVEAAKEGEVCMDYDNMLMTMCDLKEQTYCDVDDTGSCLPKKAEGEECMDDEECLSDWCDYDDMCGSYYEDECF